MTHLKNNLNDVFVRHEIFLSEEKFIKKRLMLYKADPTKVKKWEDVKADYLKTVNDKTEK